MSIALVIMTSFHPGICMGQAWFGAGSAGQGDPKMGDHARIISTDGAGYTYGGGIPGSESSSSYELNVKPQPYAEAQPYLQPQPYAQPQSYGRPQTSWQPQPYEQQQPQTY